METVAAVHSGAGERTQQEPGAALQLRQVKQRGWIGACWWEGGGKGRSHPCPSPSPVCPLQAPVVQMCPSAQRPRSAQEHSPLPLGTFTQGILPTFEPGGVAGHRATLSCPPRTSRSGYSPSRQAERDCPPGPETVTIAGSILLV